MRSTGSDSDACRQTNRTAPGLGDRWDNMQHNGKECSLDSWETYMSKATQRAAGSAKAKWRLPAAGVLEFDHVVGCPQCVLATQYRLDLSDQRERRVAEARRAHAACGHARFVQC